MTNFVTHIVTQNLIRLLRSVLSVKDEFYHRHIVQYDLFQPVFHSVLRCNNNRISSGIVQMVFPKDNLVSSAVFEVSVPNQMLACV